MGFSATARAERETEASTSPSVTKHLTSLLQKKHSFIHCVGSLSPLQHLRYTEEAHKWPRPRPLGSFLGSFLQKAIVSEKPWPNANSAESEFASLGLPTTNEDEWTADKTQDVRMRPGVVRGELTRAVVLHMQPIKPLVGSMLPLFVRSNERLHTHVHLDR